MKSKATEALFDWLTGQALPMWSAAGVDRNHGGFIEQIDPDGHKHADVRRARLVARQIYAFRLAGTLGWTGPADQLARHGQTALMRHHIGPDMVAVPRYFPGEDRTETGFDLYDQAFVLFGLSQIARLPGETSAEGIALRILAAMRVGWQHPRGGFGENLPITAPLKANPHMHLFEAAQSWLEISENQAWHALAAEIADLCLANFLDPETGALHEFFDSEWQRLPNSAEHVIEPGHQSEWAWLLVRWYRRAGADRYLAAARRLFAIAEDHGVHPGQGKLVNELHSTMAMRDPRMRLWPQTERIKALVVFCEEAENQQQRAELEARLEQAVAGLLDYFRHPLPGSWWEHIGEDGSSCDEPARASSLYHILGAAAELTRYTGLNLARA